MDNNNQLINPENELMPFSLEAEQAVLGAILIDPDIFLDISEQINPEYFYLPQHSEIARILWNMETFSKKIDSITVLEELKSAGVYDDAGGKAYLLQLAQVVPTTANATAYAKIVREKYYIRTLITASREIINQAAGASDPDSSLDAEQLISDAEQRIYEIRQNREVEGLVHIKKVITGETFDRLDKLRREEYKDEFLGIPSGISAIDSKTTGFHKSDLIILGARPGVGKTSLVLNFARNAAVNAKKTVAFFSLEMTRRQLTERLLASEASILLKKFRTGELEPDEWSRLAQASGVLSNANIFLDETSGITVSKMKAKLRRMNPKPDMVIIDYLGLMGSDSRSENRVIEIGKITNGLKSMAKELNIPVICCSQLARGERVKGQTQKPQMTSLRGSGDIEQDADIVLFIHRDIYYRDESENPEEINANSAECIIAKNRHGETGSAELHFDPQFTRFTTPDFKYGEA